MAAWSALCLNPYLNVGERKVIVALIGFAGYQMGDTLPDTARVGFITPEKIAASGVGERGWQTILPAFVELGVLTVVRRKPKKAAGHPWNDYTLAFLQKWPFYPTAKAGGLYGLYL